MTEVRLTIEAGSTEEDPNSDTGLTEDGYLRLTEALAKAGFPIIDGPVQVRGWGTDEAAAKQPPAVAATGSQSLAGVRRRKPARQDPDFYAGA